MIREEFVGEELSEAALDDGTDVQTEGQLALLKTFSDLERQSGHLSGDLSINAVENINFKGFADVVTGKILENMFGLQCVFSG